MSKVLFWLFIVALFILPTGCATAAFTAVGTAAGTASGFGAGFATDTITTKNAIMRADQWFRENWW